MSLQEPPVELAFPREQLRRRTIHGVLINAFFMGGAEGLVVLQGLIVTVLLGPRLIGLYGIVTTTAMTVNALRRVGIDEAFVQQREADQELEFQRAFTLELIVGGAFSLVLLAAAPIVTAAYGDARLLPLMAAVAYLPTAFALQAPTWLFFRTMDFVRVRTLQAIIPVLTFVVTVPLAAVGVGVWSLVIGPAAGNTAAIIACWRASPYKPRLTLGADASHRYLRFSWPVFATATALLLVGQGQVLAFDLHSGLAAAGFITLAATLTRYADRVDQIIATTLYPAICVVREQLDTQREIFESSNRVALLWSLPFCTGFVLFAPDLVHFILGRKWDPATELLQGLAAAMAIQQLGYNWFCFYRARGDSSRQAVEAAVIAGGFLALAVPGLIADGATGFVIGRIVAALLALAVRRHYVSKLLHLELLTLGVRSAVPVAASAAVVGAIRLAAWGSHRSFAQAIAELAAFLAVTAAIAWATEKRLVLELAGQLRGTSTS
jgi:O-antigen/teichoic acid export membrane protein